MLLSEALYWCLIGLAPVSLTFNVILPTAPVFVLSKVTKTIAPFSNTKLEQTTVFSKVPAAVAQVPEYILLTPKLVLAEAKLLPPVPPWVIGKTPVTPGLKLAV